MKQEAPQQRHSRRESSDFQSEEHVKPTGVACAWTASTERYSAGRPRCNACHDIYASGGAPQQRRPAGAPLTVAKGRQQHEHHHDRESPPRPRPRAEPTSTLLGVEELFVDDSYQRPADMARARRLAATWDRRLAG